MSSNQCTYPSKQIAICTPPSSEWVFGKKTEDTLEGREWMDGLRAGWKTVDTMTEDPLKIYSLLMSGVVPRPVAFVSTISEEGLENLAPYSCFNVVSAYPPVIAVSISRGPNLRDRVKDSLTNIKTTRGFTVNLISEPWIAQANVCNVDAPETVSEWSFSGLTKEPSIHVVAPRVLESAFSLECELLESIDIKHPVTSAVTTGLILGSVKCIHVRKDVLNERGSVDPGKMQPVCRLGGILYGRIKEGYSLERFTWDRYGEDLVASAGTNKSGTGSPS